MQPKLLNKIPDALVGGLISKLVFPEPTKVIHNLLRWCDWREKSPSARALNVRLALKL